MSEAKREAPGDERNRARPFALDWLGRQDSNLGSRNQNPLPYHLATPQQAGYGLTPLARVRNCPSCRREPCCANDCWRETIRL